MSTTRDWLAYTCGQGVAAGIAISQGETAPPLLGFGVGLLIVCAVILLAVGFYSLGKLSARKSIRTSSEEPK